MRQQFLLSGLMIVLALGAKAQVSSSSWALAGNTNASTTSRLGTSNATALNLSTNNVPRIYIAANGYVGIGTTAPASLFSVEGATLLSIFTSTDALSSTSGSGVIGYTKALPTASGQRLGYFLTGSQGGGTSPGNGTGMVGYSDGAWSSTSHPSYLTFETTKTGSKVRSEAMRISSNGYIGIGVTSPASRLDIADSSVAINAKSLGTNSYGLIADGGQVAVYASGGTYGLYSFGTTYGIYATGNSYGIHADGNVRGISGSGNVGVYGTSSISSGDAIQGVASGSTCYGGYFSSGSSFGVYASTGSSSSYAGYFTGNVYTSGTYTGSDKKLKKNITDVADAVSIIKKLKPKTYEFQTEGRMAEMNLPKGKHYGLIAQDLEAVLPDLVKETIQYPQHDTSGGGKKALTSGASQETFKAVNYTELIPILVKGVQEEDQKNQDQDQKIKDLEAEIQELKAMLANNISGSLSSASLEVPVPNPAKGTTNIRYSIPSGTVSARLTVVNMLGQVMKEVKLSGVAAQVNLNVSGLTSGTYPCTLWVNGQPVVSKQLVVAR